MFSLLFMQFATAAYVCPGTGMLPARYAADASGHPSIKIMCEGMDANQSILCHLHAHDNDEISKQSPDKLKTPAIPDFSPGQLTAVVLPIDVDFHTDDAVPVSHRLLRASSPHAVIRYCRFHI